VVQRQWWPWDNENDLVEPDDQDIIPEPAPPQPDPEPLPPEPEPVPDDATGVPTEPGKLNEFIGSQLGGYVRANHIKGDLFIDIYQARGRQRVAWTVGKAEDWKDLAIMAFFTKAAAGSDKGGIALVCHCPDDPDPEPLPDPVPPPGPDSDPVPDPETPIAKRLYKHGGMDLVLAEAFCNASGLWLVVVHDKTGEVSRVIYGNQVVPMTKFKSVN
jgi:hypothetical protein